MRSIVIATLFVLASTAAQAEIICTNRGCWETGAKIILTAPSHVHGQALISHRNGKPEKLRWLGNAHETTHCQFCNRN